MVTKTQRCLEASNSDLVKRTSGIINLSSGCQILVVLFLLALISCSEDSSSPYLGICVIVGIGSEVDRQPKPVSTFY